MVVAIDGPAGAGKSTIARKLAEQLGYFYLNSGSLYRGTTLVCLEEGIAASDVVSVVNTARDAGFHFGSEGLYAGERCIESQLRTDQVESRVNIYSAIPELRNAISEIIKDLAQTQDVVVEGRDMTTRVFPDARFKFYLDADIQARAARRLAQGTSNLEPTQIAEAIRKRDEQDSTREIGRLMVSPDAEYIDTTGLTIEQVCAKVVQSIQGHTLRQEN